MKGLFKNLLYATFLTLFLLSHELKAQDAKLKVTVYDAKTKETMPGASVFIESGVIKKGKMADALGIAKLPSVPPGDYRLTVSFAGYQKYSKVVTLYGDKNNDETVFILPDGYLLPGAEVIAFKKKLFDKDQTSTIHTTDHTEIQKSAYTSINNIVGQSSGVFVSDGSTPIIKGNRSNGTVYYVDGVPAIGSIGVPQGAIDQLSILTGGIPAEYGDATGGVINIFYESCIFVIFIIDSSFL